MIAAMVVHGGILLDDGRSTPDSWVAIDDGTITAIGEGSSWRSLAADRTTLIDARGCHIGPGFVDIHCHGGGGAAFGVDDLTTALRPHLQRGVTSTVVSLVTAEPATLTRQLAQVREAMALGPSILGSHLEGPFLAASHKGAHDPELLIAPTPALVDEMLQAAEGTLRQVTIAPELPGAFDAIRRFVAAGVTVAVGHTGADYELTLAAFDAGAGILTHAFNGMNGIHHRAPGPVLAAVETSHVTLELVADGVHVSPEVAAMLVRLAPHRVALVSDAMAAAGFEDGRYLLGSLEVDVTHGVARLTEGGSIAGSTLILDSAFDWAVKGVGMSVAGASAAVTSVPALALGLESRVGRVLAGRSADLVVLDSALRPSHVIHRGVPISPVAVH